MPSTSSSALSEAIISSSSSSVMLSGLRIVVFRMPTSAEALALPVT